MLVNHIILTIINIAQTLLRVDTLTVSNATGVASFFIVAVLIIALFYSLITLRSQNKLIATQNEEILSKNKQLQLQNKKLKKINEEKTNLIGVVSHDLKSPFNRIFALLNLLKLTNKNISEENLEYLSKMHLVIKDGLALIRNLLDIRAIEDEGIKIVLEQVDMVKLLNDILKAHKPLAEIKHIKLKLTKDIDTLVITSDKLYLSRIIENLLSNALKFSEHDSVIEVKIVMCGDDYFQIEVLDQGPGILEEEMKLLFQKYQILSARPTGGESSTGLGLSIVKTLVDKIGGEVSCSSKMGEGAKFTVKIPIEIPN